MSFALFQEVMKVIPNPESVTELLLSDFYMREYIARRLLTGNKKVVKDEDMVELFDLEFDDEAIDDLIIWATDHILYFFTSTAEKSLKLGEKYKAKMAAIIPSNPSPTGAPS